MSAQDKQTGAPSGAPTLDDAANAVILGAPPGGTVVQFLDRLRTMAQGLDISQPESDYYALEHALQIGAFQSIDDDAGLYAISARKLSEYVCWWRAFVDAERAAPQTLSLKIDTSAVQAEIDKAVAEFEAYRDEHRRLVRELDVALNGEMGAALQASLCDLVAQVRSQRGVQVLNMADGMRINFRAPDGRRATLHLARLLTPHAIIADDEVFATMEDAIAAYPVAGEPLPELHSDAHDMAQVQALGEGSQVHPESALPSRGQP
jgi:hypothetical protein